MLIVSLTQNKLNKINYNQHNGVFLWLNGHDGVHRHLLLSMVELCSYLNNYKVVALCPKSVGISLVPSYFIIEAT
mgnify:FL=1